MEYGFLSLNGTKQRGLYTALLILSIIIGISVLFFPFYVPLLLLFSILLIFFITEKPESGLIMAVLSTPLMNVMLGYGHHPSSVSFYEKYNFLIVDIVLIITIIAIAIGRVTEKVEPFKRHNVDMPILILTVYSALTLLWAKDLTYGFCILLQFLSCILLFYTPVILLRGKRILKTILWLWLLSGVFAGVIALTTLYVKFEDLDLFNYKFYLGKNLFYFHTIILENIKQRVGGLADPNRMSFLFNTVLMSGLALFLTIKKRSLKVLITILTLFVLYVDIHTLSKGGYGSLFFTFIIYVMIHPRFKGRQLKTLAFFFAVFIILFMVMAAIDLGGGLGRFGQSPVEVKGSTSLALRFKWWSVDFDALLKTNGLGAGIGGLSDYIFAYAQSSYFSLLGELGLIGSFIALWLVLTYSTDLYSIMKTIKGDNLYFTAALSFTGCVVIFFIHSLVDFSYILRIPWLMAGLAVATAKLGLHSETYKPGENTI